MSRAAPETMIWKFQLAVESDGRVLLKMPQAAELLHVALQRDVPCLWAKVVEYSFIATRLIYVRGTGHALGEANGKPYVGTFETHDGNLIWHVFDGGEVTQ